MTNQLANHAPSRSTRPATRSGRRLPRRTSRGLRRVAGRRVGAGTSAGTPDDYDDREITTCPDCGDPMTGPSVSLRVEQHRAQRPGRTQRARCCRPHRQALAIADPSWCPSGLYGVNGRELWPECFGGSQRRRPDWLLDQVLGIPLRYHPAEVRRFRRSRSDDYDDLAMPERAMEGAEP